MKVFRILAAIVVLTLGSGASAQTLTNLHSFGGFSSDGANPQAGLAQGSDGNFYGTTRDGGTSTNCPAGCGTVFRISPSGTYTTLYSFVGSPTDGAIPSAGLVQGSDDNLYGTTVAGGLYNTGTVFRIIPSGTYTTLYSFVGSPTDGGNPGAELVQSSDSNLYGTTVRGGTSTNCPAGCGAVFRISPSGTYTMVYSFVSSPTDGSRPNMLVQGSDGDFYGTAFQGGTNKQGTVFRISPGGTLTNLYRFVGHPADGWGPSAGLVQGSDGNFYGTTVLGGTNEYGTVFRISPSGTYTTLYSFVGSPTDGASPFAGLVQGSDGNLYGTTYFGGQNDYGTVFRMSPGGGYSTLYSFTGSPTDGAYPRCRIVQGEDGSFYGTTYHGGMNNSGTVYRLSMLLNPPPYPINQITGVQLSGTNVVFNIPSIAGETYQLQLSSSMNPTNWVNVPGVSVTNSIGALLTLTNFGGAVGPQGFYRFDITP